MLSSSKREDASDAGTIAASFRPTATWAAPTIRAGLPNAFASCTRTRRPPMLVRTIIRTVCFLNVSGIGPIGEGLDGAPSGRAAWGRGGGAPSTGTGARAKAVAQVATQCSFALSAAFCCAAERHKEKLNKQMVLFMVYLPKCRSKKRAITS